MTNISSTNGTNGTHGINGTKDHKSSTQCPPRQHEVTGLHEAFNFGGNHLHGNVLKLMRSDPPLGNRIVDNIAEDFGTLNLTYQDLAMNVSSMLLALGDTPNQLRVYVEAALRHGADVEEVLDLVQLGASFAGMPRAVNALRGLESTLDHARKGHLPEGYTESLVRVGDHDTMVRDTHGAGVPIVLVHALCLDGRMYKYVVPALAAATGARVIAYDLRGHGFARGAPLTKNIQHLCADLELLLDTLGIEKADIYGCSYGGAVAQNFALDYTHRVRSICPIAIAAKGVPFLATRASRAEESGVLAQLPETIIRWFLPETIASSPWCVRFARARVERATVAEWAAAWRALSKFDALSRLHELKMPVMALSGTHDLSSTPEHMKAIIDACTDSSDAELVSIELGSHMMIMEKPEECADALIAFRKKVDSASAHY